MGDTHGARWDERYASGDYQPRTASSSLVDEAIEYIGSGKALDLACGTGRSALRLARGRFADWRATVRVVIKLNLLLNRPNPRYRGEKVEGLIEVLHAEHVRLRANADSGSLATSSSWFEQAMDHIREGYGTARLSG